MVTAFLGPRGTFSEDAAVAFAGPNGELLPVGSIPGAVAALQNSEATTAVLPIENSIEGAVSVTLDLLIYQTDLPVIAELVIPVRLFLIAIPGASLDQITVVTSHSNPLGQSRRFLEQSLPQAAPIAALSTAAAVQEVMTAGDPTRAAIGTLSAARMFGGQVLASDIQDMQTNVTRFVVLGKQPTRPSGDDKTSIAFLLKANVPGALFRVLRPLAEGNIQMSKLESRPSREEILEYVFLCDFLGHRDDPKIAQTLVAIEDECSMLKVFGSYPRFPLERIEFAASSSRA